MIAGLDVFPGRMRENLDAQGNSIMAESAMMALADVVGRADAHALVSEAAAAARSEGLTLRAALERALEPETLAAIRPLDDVLDPGSYLGETDAIVTAALDGMGSAPRRSSATSRSGGWKSSTVIPSGSLR